MFSLITAVISENFDAVELLGLRELMVNHDFKRIDEYEKLWRERHGEPVIPDFVHDKPAAGTKNSPLRVNRTRGPAASPTNS